MASPSSPQAIRLENIEFKVPGEVILEHVNLNVANDEIFVLVGPSGKGKTVLLKLIAGLLSPTRGLLKIHDADLITARGKARDSILGQMGMLFQKNALFDSLTVGNNVAFPLREMNPEPENFIDKKVELYLDAVGILHAKDLFPDEISGGMQKRLGIARALALNPEILLLDDPTAGLDPITSRKIVDLILQIQKDNKTTIVAVTNDMNRAFQLGDRIGLVADRTLLVTGTVEETKAHRDPRVQQFIHGSVTGPLSATT